MKLKLISMMICILTTTGILYHECSEFTKTDILVTARSEKSEYFDLSLLFPPGEERIYKGNIFFNLQMNQDNKIQEQKVALALKLIVQSHQIHNDSLLWSMSASELKNLDGNQLPENLTTERETLYFLSEQGKIKNIHFTKNGNEMLQSLLQSIAERIQVPAPKPVQQILPFNWSGEEKDRNGTYQIDLQAKHETNGIKISKFYKSLESNLDIVIANDNSVDLSINPVTNTIDNFSFDFGLKNLDAMMAIDVTIKANFDLVSTNHRAEIGNVIENLSDELTSQDANNNSYYASPSREKMMTDILDHSTKQELLEVVTSFENEQDKKISTILNKLEALLYLYPQMGGELLTHLAVHRLDPNFSAQLSVIMGAISTMKAEHIESDLLKFAETYHHIQNVELQSSFALAEIFNSSDKVFDYLVNMTEKSQPQTKNTGLLSLGVLGKQDRHRDEVRNVLRDQFSEVPANQKGIVLAALNNSHDPENLPINIANIGAQDEYLAEQAVYGLGSSQSDDAYYALLKVFKTETRTHVLVRAIEAMAPHLERDGVIRDLIELSMTSNSEQVMKQIINVLAGSTSLEARTFMEDLSVKTGVSKEIQTHAKRALNTLHTANI